MKDKLIAFYLDYLNNYITTSKMAEDYGLDLLEVNTLINWGKRYHTEYTDYLNAKHDPTNK